MLDGPRIEQALARLDEVLDHEHVRAEALVVGGAAMTLLFPTRRSTVDVDAVFAPAQVRDAAYAVAEELGLPNDWLNDGVKGFLVGDDPSAKVAFAGTALLVRVASPRYLLAMKLAAARTPIDADDILILAEHLGITSAEEALEIVTEYYPPSQLLPKTRFLAEELFGPLTS